jgi:hypothetical protein
MMHPHILKNMPPVAGKLGVSYVMDLEPDGWKVGNVKGSYNSYFLYKNGDSRQFHIRWYKSDKNALYIFPLYYHGGKGGIRIETDDELMQLILKITKPSRMKKFKKIVKAA